MEGDTRRLQPASIGMASIETGVERYPADGHLRAPPVAPWRNNVTALSQRYNLYFVATKENIAVFQPQFPYQKLGRTPSLVISPTLANKNARGYIEPACPHAINHLIVGDLGNEEILLVARDSGNVDAYHTRSVRDAIEKEPYLFNKDRRADYVGLRAFFSHWLHESAWGLAIHKEARMIAVSANIPRYVRCEDSSAKITVFAFALADSNNAEGGDDESSDDDDDATDSEWQDWTTSSANCLDATFPPRDRNYKVVLGGSHANNMPSLSFVNSSEDREGLWLFSTDIEGDMFAWNIWRNRIVNSWTTTSNEIDQSVVPMRGESTLVRGVARRIDGLIDSGWLVAALDPKAFAVASTMVDFCGAPAEVRPRHKSESESFSVTYIAGLQVPGNSQRHPRYRQLVADSDVDEEPPTDEVEQATSLDDLLSEQEDADELEPVYPGSLELISPPDVISAGLLVTYPEDLDGAEEEDGSTSNDQDRDRDNFSQSSRNSSSASSLNIPTSSHGHHLRRQFVPSVEEGEQDLLVHGGGAMVQSFDASIDETRLLPKIPLLHCSVSHVRLFNAPLAERAHWFCADLLTQLVTDEFARTAEYAMERLNMVQQIPELGIVIIASQGGRCAVCSTMRKTRDGPYGLRVDWVLPTKQQEKAQLRPPHTLLGIAVGPIQGMMKEDGNEEIGGDDEFKDRVISGTPTSFDTTIVVMNSSEDESRSSNDEGDAAQAQSKQPIPTSEIHPKVKQRPWSHSPAVESWRGVDYSRRYRLMLTYYDWTVLTYEIAREAPHLGIHPSRKNYRNRHNTSTVYHGSQSRPRK